jgi:hypothetical protein
MTLDYELPKVEKLVAPKIAEGLVKPGQYGTDRVFPVQLFNEYNDDGVIAPVEAHDYIVFCREGGYVVDDHSRVSLIGLRIDCWAKTRSRAEDLMNEVVKRMLALEDTEIDGFNIWYVESLRGPEEEKDVVLHDERCFTKAFELRIDPKWIKV